jgi:3-hydroxyisobutyrate dehydrogenase-like beta-hydroxyacid dehydrogenase
MKRKRATAGKPEPLAVKRTRATAGKPEPLAVKRTRATAGKLEPLAMKRTRATAGKLEPLAMKRTRAIVRHARRSGRHKPTVGVIGLGIMGSAMAASLLRARFRVVGYDILPRSRQQLRRAGGVPVSDCAAVGRESDFIITSLPSSDALIDVATQLIADPKAPHRSRLHRIIIETSTLAIPVKEEARAILATCGAVLLDCPLSGTGAQARNKDLVVYASGDRAAYAHATPVLEAFSRAHYYVGPFGAGSKMKFAANLLVAIHNVAAAEALVLMMKSGIDPALALKVLGDGAGTSRMLQVRGPMMVKGDYASDVTMKLAVWQKDMTVISEFAKAAGCPTPLFAATAPLYLAATASNPTEDTGAVCAVLEALANYRRKQGSGIRDQGSGIRDRGSRRAP